ncbi:MAG: hypothetical protein ABIP78_01505 [Pyrinomonadaceae bacterium]
MELASPKDKNIEKLLENLFGRFGKTNFELTNYWDGDLCAIGLRNSSDKEFLIYVSTWAIQENRYFVEIEDSDSEVVLNGYTNGNRNELEFEEVCQLVAKYFRLQPIYEK